ncbi:MAG: tripartite tricarboxylate transporter substrate binding protein [Burkholderiales bacterium]|nr:tripartite tricarboxylate transporter substrate binding protein [Burkholderiales bacterium]
MIVPWVAGGGTDIVARILVPKLSDSLGQQVLVDNRPGANGIVGSEIAARATPDGYTIILEAVEHVINASTYAKLPYDTINDFAPVGLIAGHSLVLIVSPTLPVKSVSELVALARTKPGQFNFGSWGEGSLAHFAGELLKIHADIRLTHVPYKGAPQAIIDILGGRLPLMFTTMPTGAPPIKQGKLRALAVTSPRRDRAVPDVPTMVESGYPGFEVESWRAVYAPAGTPRALITRLNREFVSALQMPDVKERIVAAGFDVRTSTPEELDKFGKAELAKWAKVAKFAGVRIE